MGLEIYKKGQGTWARGVGYVCCGLLVLFGAIRLFAFYNVPGQHVWIKNVPLLGNVSMYHAIALAAFLIGMLLVHLVLNREDLVNLLIDTEQEMKKVSWPSKAEVWSATIVVVLVTALLAGLLFGFDIVLQRVFKLIF